jgi:hypothetical protein
MEQLVSRRRAAWHSSAANFNNTAHLVTEGPRGCLGDSLDNGWISAGGDEEWVLVDLSGSTRLTKAVVCWGTDCAVRYSLQGSDDGTGWTELALAEGAPDTAVTTPLNGASYRYIRILCEVSAVDRYHIRSAEIWGSVTPSVGSADMPPASPHTMRRLTAGASGIASDALSSSLPPVRAVRSAGGHSFASLSNRALQRGDVGIAPDEEHGDNVRTPKDNGSVPLTHSWRVQRASEIAADGSALSLPGYDDADWLPAVVPGTVLSSWLAAGAVPDPNIADWQFQVSEAFFTAGFWYRTAFSLPASQKGRRVFLHFDAVNWKADVYLNGQLLTNAKAGRQKSIEGAFIRGVFDITDAARFGEENILAVYIYKNDTPGAVTTQGLAEGPGPNGGLLGADTPTLHASVGWDWLPTIRGRNIGIYGDVFLRFSGSVSLSDPWMQTDLDLTETSALIAAEDLTKRLGVAVSSGAEAVLDCGSGQWSGGAATPGKQVACGAADLDMVGMLFKDTADTNGFVVDLGCETPVGSVTLVWGTEAGGAAADLESRHPEKFRLERSLDGTNWEAFDAYPGGAVDMEWFGRRDAAPFAGTDSYEGHAISDSVQGGTAFVPVDMTAWGMGKRDIPVFAPQRARYLRFTALESRKLGGRPVPVCVREIRVYRESPLQVEQSLTRSYALDPSKSVLTFRTEVTNHENRPVTAVISGVITPDDMYKPVERPAAGFIATPSLFDTSVAAGRGSCPVPGTIGDFGTNSATRRGLLTFAQPVKLEPGETKTVEIDGLTLQNPRLWWPNTYGEQHLYTCDVGIHVDEVEADTQSFRFGVRRFDYPVDGGLLTLYCNGVRIVAKGGNWGMDDGLKRDTSAVYDHKVRLHAEANMTMIRNWVGQTHHPAFYDACDKYGVLIWDDFWLANPVDGPDPKDPALFLENAADKIKCNRHHAALALYCGRNEGNPPPVLEDGLQAITKALDGTRLYFPNSASAPVGSGGGYSLAWPGGIRGVKQYFNDVTSPVLRSERGIPNVPELSSLRRFVPQENLWPISEIWALNDWTYHMNGPASSYMAALQGYLGGSFEIPEDNVQGQAPDPSDPVFAAYKAAVYEMADGAGKAWTVEDFNRAAQLINYEHHRGLFEAMAARRSNGLLMWMSQSSWPSFMWQTYDWYLDTNGGYFGAKAGNQPTRAVWDPRDDSIVLANATGQAYRNVTTQITVYDLHGRPARSDAVKTADLASDTCGVVIAKADFSASGTELVFLRLILRGETGTVLGENTYWHNRRNYQDYTALNTLGEAPVKIAILSADPLPSGGTRYVLALENSGDVPAVQVSIKALDANGDMLLPVFFSENYITLLPGDRKTVTAEVPLGRARKFKLGGWNTAEREFPL